MTGIPPLPPLPLLSSFKTNAEAQLLTRLSTPSSLTTPIATRPTNPPTRTLSTGTTCLTPVPHLPMSLVMRQPTPLNRALTFESSSIPLRQSTSPTDPHRLCLTILKNLYGTIQVRLNSSPDTRHNPPSRLKLVKRIQPYECRQRQTPIHQPARHSGSSCIRF